MLTILLLWGLAIFLIIAEIYTFVRDGCSWVELLLALGIVAVYGTMMFLY